MTTQRKVPDAQQATTSRKIEAIRIAALASLGSERCGDSCPTCTRRACDPYRRHDARGNVVEGCIDAYHHEAMDRHYSCASRNWHFRPVAHALRKDTLAHLESL